MLDVNTITEVSNLVMLQAMTLDERLACIFKTSGGKDLNLNHIVIDDVHGFNGMSGYNYWNGDTLVAQLYMGTLLTGTYVIYKKTFFNNELKEVYDYYDNEGRFFYSSQSLDSNTFMYTSIMIDPTNPFINHIYNILNLDYDSAVVNMGNTIRIKTYEGLLKKFYKSNEISLSINESKLKDKALLDIKDNILQVEKNNHLKWSERQEIFKKLKDVRSKILYTKRRVHGLSWILYDLLVFFTNFKLKWELYKNRPVNNFLGTLYKMTIGNFIWFAKTVRENIGFSMAMAIYGPFTFYFITQPMNPHAMWAVGKVRQAYIEVVNTLEGPVEEESPQKINLADSMTSDSVSTIQAGNSKQNAEDAAKKWDERMSSFKAMQIAYEGDMVFAARMGRVEQFETQFNFPLTAEAAWMEMEMYLKKLNADYDFNKKSLDRRYIKFIKNEKRRTLELQKYIWQKMGQFFLDHPYIVVDQDEEQPEKSYYLGRQFVFFSKMTRKLAKEGLIKNTNTHKNVSYLAKNYQKMKVDGNSVLDTLKKNSKLFRQKDFFDTDEHRDYMRRQWEILFLQQNKKQEASSFALQTYTWSVKNAMWLLQTIYSAKRSELSTLTYKYNVVNTGTHSIKADPVSNEYLENMFHNLTMEFVSIKKELARNLKDDDEAILREEVINNLKEYIIERDQLLNTGVYASIIKESKNI